MDLAVARRQLLERLERFELGPNVLDDCARFFDAAGDPWRARWMNLERSGYGVRTDAENLREVVGADAPEDVLATMLRCRLRYGRLRAGAHGPVVKWPHFFIETLDLLRDWRNRVAHSPAGEDAMFEFTGQRRPNEPRALVFSPAVFTDVVETVNLEVADAVRRVVP